jgi:hypothetical protein
VYTLASAFITGCPSTNPALPVKAYPALATTGTVIAGGNIGLSYTQTNGTLYAVFLNGLSSTVVPLNSTTTQVTIPASLRGYAYVFISTDATGADLTQTVAGPTILDLVFDSNNKAMVAKF